MSNCRKLGLAIASLGCPALDRIHQIPEQQFDWARRFHRSNTLHCLVAGLRSHEPSPLAPEPSSYKHRNGTADAATPGRPAFRIQPAATRLSRHRSLILSLDSTLSFDLRSDPSTAARIRRLGDRAGRVTPRSIKPPNLDRGRRCLAEDLVLNLH